MRQPLVTAPLFICLAWFIYSIHYCRGNLPDMVYDFWQEKFSPLDVSVPEILYHIIRSGYAKPSGKWISQASCNQKVSYMALAAWFRCIRGARDITLDDMNWLFFTGCASHEQLQYVDNEQHALETEALEAMARAQRAERPADVTERIIQLANMYSATLAEDMFGDLDATPPAQFSDSDSTISMPRDMQAEMNAEFENLEVIAPRYDMPDLS